MDINNSYRIDQFDAFSFIDIMYSNVSQGHDNLKVVSCSGFKGCQDCTTNAFQACPNGFEIKNKEENLLSNVKNSYYDYLK